MDLVGILAFGLIPGPRELVIVAVVVLALYGRSSTRLLMATPYGRRFAPWLSLIQRAAAPRAATPRERTPPPASRRGLWRPRAWWSWALLLAAVGMAAALVAIRITVHNAALSH